MASITHDGDGFETWKFQVLASREHQIRIEEDISQLSRSVQQLQRTADFILQQLGGVSQEHGSSHLPQCASNREPSRRAAPSPAFSGGRPLSEAAELETGEAAEERSNPGPSLACTEQNVQVWDNAAAVDCSQRDALSIPEPPPPAPPTLQPPLLLQAPTKHSDTLVSAHTISFDTEIFLHLDSTAELYPRGRLELDPVASFCEKVAAGKGTKELQRPVGAMASNGPLLDGVEAARNSVQPEARASHGLQASHGPQASPSETPFSTMLHSLKNFAFQRSPSTASYRQQSTKLSHSLEASRELNSTMNKAKKTARTGMVTDDDTSATLQPSPRSMLQAGVALVQAGLWDVVHPKSWLRLRWDLLILALLVYLCVEIPFVFCFNVGTDVMSNPLVVVDLIVNLVFLVDITFNFRTTYLDDDGKPVTSRKLIAWNYCTSWFLIDFVSSIPLDLFVGSSSSTALRLLKLSKISRIAKLVRLLKLVKMLRLLRLPSLMQQLEDIVGGAMLRFVTFITGALLLIHWTACIFFWVALRYSPRNHSWLTAHSLRHAALSDKYIYSLYWAVTTMSTVGYGDVVPKSAVERYVAIVGMVLGASVFAYMMGAMSNVVANMNSNNTRMSRKWNAVADFLQHRRLPPGLARKVREYYSYVLEKELHADEATIIAGLSSTLKEQVVLHLYREAVERVPVFRQKGSQFIAEVVTCLKCEYYTPGDVVVIQGDIGDQMYFISEGELEVRIYHQPSQLRHQPPPLPAPTLRRIASTMIQRASSQARMAWTGVGPPAAAKSPRRQYTVVGKLEAGQYFGEYATMTGSERTATVVSTTFCELYSLSRAELDKLQKRYPELAQDFQKIGRANEQTLTTINMANNLHFTDSVTSQQVVYSQFKMTAENLVGSRKRHSGTMVDSEDASLERFSCDMSGGLPVVAEMMEDLRRSPLSRSNTKLSTWSAANEAWGVNREVSWQTQGVIDTGVSMASSLASRRLVTQESGRLSRMTANRGAPGGTGDTEPRAPRKQQRFVEGEASEVQLQAVPQPRTSRGSGSEIKQQVTRTSASQLPDEQLAAVSAPPCLRPPPLPTPQPQQQQQPPRQRPPAGHAARRDAFQGVQEGQNGGGDPDPMHKASSSGSGGGGTSRRSSLSKERVPGSPSRDSLEVSWGPPTVLPALGGSHLQPREEAPAAAAPAVRSLQAPEQADPTGGVELPQRASGARGYDI